MASTTKKIEPKIMPHSIEAEQAVLGCALIDEEAPISIMSKLVSNDFYSDAHKTIFDAMMNIYSVNKPIDFVTLTDELEKKNELDVIGGIDYITTLTNIVPSAANFSHYVDIVKRDSVFRKLIGAGQKIVENAYASDEKSDAISFAEKQVFDIAQKEDVSSLEQIEPAVNEVFENLNLIAKNKGANTGVLTGFTELDRITRGLQKSDLILIAARPSVGKSALANNIVNYAAINEKKKCAVFSLEMPKTQIAQRSLFSIANVQMEKGKNGQLDTEEWKRLWAAKKQLAEADIYVDDSSVINPVELLSKCRRLKREKGLDLVMIDYLQLMTAPGKAKDNRQLEISEITRYLKIAARELNVPIIVLSQMSRDIEKRKDHEPMLSDLRESGAIEQDADIVLFIHNPGKYNDIVGDFEPDDIQLKIAKHRNGELGVVDLKWVGEYVKFVNPKETIRRAPVKQVQKEETSKTEGVEEINAEGMDELSDLW